MSESSSIALFRTYALRPEEDIDLGRSCFAIAQEEYKDLDIEKEVRRLDELADLVKVYLPASRDPGEMVEALSTFLFSLCGFAGNVEEYYDPRNSYLNDVLDSRKGIPITLSVLLMETSRRVGLPLLGVGMPGHFLVKYEDYRSEFFIDSFNGGEILERGACRARFERVLSPTTPWDASFLEPVTKRAMLLRMLYNLKSIFVNHRDTERALAAIEKILVLIPDAPQEIRDRGLLRANQGDLWSAVADLEDYLELSPEAPDVTYVRQQTEVIRRKLRGDNEGEE